MERDLKWKFHLLSCQEEKYWYLGNLQNRAQILIKSREFMEEYCWIFILSIPGDNWFEEKTRK